jgi:hypothetical protein
LRIRSLLFAVMSSVALPAGAQHSHGGSGMEPIRRPERPKVEEPALPRGMLPVGSPRTIEVLLLDYGFSPTKMSADVGETVILGIRRVDPVCNAGLTISGRPSKLELPIGETVPVTIEVKRAERIELRCEGEDAAAVLVVGSP